MTKNKKNYNSTDKYRMSVEVSKPETAEKVERWLAENGYTNITRRECCGIGTGLSYEIDFDCPDITRDEMAALDYTAYFQRRAQIIKAVKEGISKR